MPRRLLAELKQSKPFPALADEVYLEIQRTAQVSARWVVEALKPFNLTPPQFNVLRILRGARPEALKSSAIADRMVTHDPDLTRLLDRMAAAGLVEKTRDPVDRRAVSVRITGAGLRLIGEASEAVSARMAETLGALGKQRLNTLADLLELVRQSTS